MYAPRSWGQMTYAYLQRVVMSAHVLVTWQAGTRWCILPQQKVTPALAAANPYACKKGRHDA